MRFHNPKKTEEVYIDMTPMIDMTFLLITFFMMLINFSQSEQNPEVDLPVSALVKPVDEATKEELVTLQFKKKGTVLFMADEISVGANLEQLIDAERRRLDKDGKLDNAIVLIRADKSFHTGEIQRAIDICQRHKFERFRFRVLEKQ